MAPEVPRVRYDRESDVLYISTQPGKRGIAEETLPGVLWRYEVAGGNIVGVTILDFSSYWKPRLDELVHDLEKRLRISPHKAKSLLRTNS